MISRPELAQVIAQRTLHIADMHKLKLSVASYLLAEIRVDELDSLMRDVLKIRAQNGHVEATVVSAFPLTQTVKDSVKAELKNEYPQAKSYVLNELVDLGVIGGIRLEVAGEELDLTIRAKLNTLKRLTTAGDR